MATYPVWRFHQVLKPEGCIVTCLEEDIALGDGWVDSPAKLSNEPPQAEPIKVELVKKPKGRQKKEAKK